MKIKVKMSLGSWKLKIGLIFSTGQGKIVSPRWNLKNEQLSPMLPSKPSQSTKLISKEKLQLPLPYSYGSQLS